ncbi:MAG TPA: glycosyltransferase family 39 protein [Pyrinomonadaceae bacterium]|nr:glycosyltransferase family 39 protein [Pyrinomonadaceae bacterium]
MTSDPSSSQQPALSTSRLRIQLIACFAIFLIAFGVRVLTWHDTRLEVGKIQTVVVADYQRVAESFRAGGVRSFFSSASALADLNTLGHPPGYSILIAGIYSIAGPSVTAVQMFQIAADALAAVILFLIIAELLPLSAGVIAGLLAAFSPQLAWNSVLLLPDSISALPILLAIYLLTRAVKNPRLMMFILIGALIGVSCWLRANAMLLTLFLAAAVLLTFTRKRWQFALAVICGTLLIVLPLTIRNAVVFHRFIPLSLGAGQTFLEGIADYDKEARFGVPGTDMGIMKQEAEIYQRPDYYGTLFNPDGVERERARLSRGFAIVRSHPFWFAGVMAKRASTMLRLERSRLLSREPAITHQQEPSSERLVDQDLSQILSEANPKPAQITDERGITRVVTFVTNDERYGVQIGWPLPAKRNNDYLIETAVKVESGRVRLSVIAPSGQILNSTVVEPVEGKTGPDAYVAVTLPFVATDDNLRIIISNEGSANNVVSITSTVVSELGAARFLWTRYPRFLLHGIQRMFITAAILPLAVIGLLIVIFRTKRAALVILSVVPIYFFIVQSAVHTEYRYVIAVTYFMFAFAGVGIGCGVDFALKKLSMLVGSSSSETKSAAPA